MLTLRSVAPPPSVVSRSIDYYLPVFFMTGPRVTEVSLSPKQIIAQRLPNAILTLDSCQTPKLSAPCLGIVEAVRYSIVKVQCMRMPSLFKKTRCWRNLANSKKISQLLFLLRAAKQLYSEFKYALSNTDQQILM